MRKLTPCGATAPTPGNTALNITGKLSTGVGDNGFDVDSDGRRSAQDGIMIMRYAFGVTSGAGPTERQTNVDSASVAAYIGHLHELLPHRPPKNALSR